MSQSGCVRTRPFDICQVVQALIVAAEGDGRLGHFQRLP